MNIAALSQRTGVAPDTLRKWEKRYGVLRPSRTTGGQRRYHDRDVARIEWVVARLGEGFRIGEVAALLGDEEPEDAGPGKLLETLLSAAARADGPAVGRLLDRALALGRPADVVEELVEPLLHRVGDLWETGELSVAQEHLVSAAVRARLDRVLAESLPGVRGTAVLACPEGERHELGVLAAAVALQADGWRVAYLGADTPLADVLDLAGRLDAGLLGLGVTMPGADERLAGLRARPRGLRVILGGREATPALARSLGAECAGTPLQRAVEALREPSVTRR